MTATGASQTGAAAPSLRTWVLFAALRVGMFMGILDVQVVAQIVATAPADHPDGA